MGNIIAGLVKLSFTLRQKGRVCVFDVESNWEDQDQFKWTVTVQEVVTGGGTDDDLQTVTVGYTTPCTEKLNKSIKNTPEKICFIFTYLC